MNERTQNFLKAVEYPRLLGRLAGHCQTPAGRDYLKAFEPLDDPAAIDHRMKRTETLEAHRAQNQDPAVPDSQYFIESFEKARSQGRVLSGPELAALLKFLGEVVKLRQYLDAGKGPEKETPAVFQEWLARLHALPELREFLRSKVSEKGEVLDSASPELKSLRDSIRSLKAEVQNFYQSFIQNAETAGALQDKIVTEREGRLVVPVKRDHQGQVPGFVHGMSSSGATLFVEPREVVENNNRVKEALLKEDEEVRKVLREATQSVLAAANELEETLVACAEVDAHFVLAVFASRYDGQFTRPREGALLSVKTARHPLLALEAREQFREKVVPIDVDFKEGVRVILVSGPNAGGKTVALKTLGLCCAMAHAGIPLLSRPESSIPLLKAFDCDLEDEQSLADHLSTYAAKLKALKRMLDHGQEGTLYLLDELGAGTDPREGGALGLACLEAFREKGAWVMANTHQPLLKLLTQEEKGMANAAMVFDEKTGKPTFRLVEGIPGQSYALTLARQMGFDEGVLEKAKAHLPQGEADLSEILTQVGQEKQAALKAREEAERARDHARKLEAELLIARRQMKDEARLIKKQAQTEAEGLLKNTRRKVEHIIQGVEPSKGRGVDREKVNSARREVNQKIKNIAPKPVRQVAEIQDLAVGDKVFFKPGQCDVTVVSTDEDKLEAVIQMENGLKLSCKWADLGRVSKAPNPSTGLRAKPPAATGVMSEKAMAEKGKLEIDLRGKLVDQALPLLDKFLDDALLVNLPFVRIIHGKGTGALKEAIHKHLPTSHPGLEFALAEPSQGGAGATVVKFKK